MWQTGPTANSKRSVLIDEYAGRLDADGLHYLARVRESAQNMAHLIDALLNLARVSKADIHNELVNLSSLAPPRGVANACPAAHYRCDSSVASHGGMP